MPPRPANPLRSDPSRTAGERRRFRAEFARRLNRVRAALRRLIVDEDAFGLRPQAGNGRWRFLSRLLQLEAFRTWLAAEIDREVFGSAWWVPHVSRVYARAALRTFDDARGFAGQLASGVPGLGDVAVEFLRLLARGSGLSSGMPLTNAARITPQARDVVGRFISEEALTFAKRLEGEMRGATAKMSQDISRIVMDGMHAGKSPEQMAREIAKTVDGVSEKRALLIARTEFTRVAAEAQLDAMEVLGVTETEAEVEWETTGNPCKFCAAMAGSRRKVSEARGLIPLHPACKCAWRVVRNKARG